MGELAILDSSGDTRLQWDPGNSSEVKHARDQFDSFRKKGYAAFKVSKSGGQGEQIDSFDPNVQRLILIPPMVGG